MPVVSIVFVVSVQWESYHCTTLHNGAVRRQECLHINLDTRKLSFGPIMVMVQKVGTVRGVMMIIMTMTMMMMMKTMR